MAGVHVFGYRGATGYSLANQIIVLHPDEKHDGRAGTDGPFRYRAVNIQPAQLQTALGGAPLPHLDGGVSTDPRLAAVVRDLLRDFDRVLFRQAYGLSPRQWCASLQPRARSVCTIVQ